MLPTIWTLLALACAQPEPCDTLCESSGFQNIEETNEGCFCSESDGLGGRLTQDACDDYCDALGAGAGTLESTQETDDTCVCESAS
jgi:hypothetical protein